jgi:BirA family biotin operon repressor/biotin-[acetyl-CoA-carboxylase] ligase
VSKIYWFREADSTQKQLLADLKAGRIAPPVLYATTKQTAGIGSRGRGWIGIEGNLFFSFAIPKAMLPKDLPLASASIYFGYLFKEELAARGSRVWLKWPNDFYLDKKIGGCITQMAGDILVCGIGLNTRSAPQGFEKLDISVDHTALLESFWERVQKGEGWKQIFSKYSVEFHKSLPMLATIEGKKRPLFGARLCEDGSIEIEGERIYSLR